MDDSDQDFVDLGSKLLKRVRRKPLEPRPLRKAEPQPSSQASERDKRRRHDKNNKDSAGPKCSGSQSVCAGAGEQTASRGAGRGAGDAGSSSLLSATGPRADISMSAKDKVLHRMQQFKRASPQRMMHGDRSQPASQEQDCAAISQQQRQDPPEPCSSGLHMDSDEALALQLQQELDREAAEGEMVDLEDGGYFFCQICHRDLSHMSPQGRTQHLNRCLDKSEGSAPAPPPPPGVPDCPICGKKFKSQKSRSAHLKRCSSDMGVSPAVLLQVVQRQAEETQNAPSANTLAQAGGTKRKAPPKPGQPARKRSKKKTDALDEDTMVALALSSSLLEQDRELKRELPTEISVAQISMIPTLKWRPDAGKGRGKKKKNNISRPPPLLLVQDAQAALMRLQERVSALLLSSRPPSPPTPTRSPSSLCDWSGSAPLWQKSTLLDDSTCPSDYYTPELREFITPWESAMTSTPSSNATNKPESSPQPVSEGTEDTEPTSSRLPSSSQPAPSTPETGQVSVGSRTLQNLMELAEDGITLTQHGYTSTGPDKNKQSSARVSTNLQLSGFVPEEFEEQAELCTSGFLPEAAHPLSEDTQRKSDQPRPNKEQSRAHSVAVSRLASDLSSMVNNPQLSDLQLQVDSGDIYFAHSFMVYARCPLLAEMVHESGFGVQEEGLPAAQRVVMSDVPGEAVLSLLQYLYTAHCSVPASLRPHVLELASRFDLQELQQVCELHQKEAGYLDQDTNVNDKTDQALMDVLRSMWNEDNEEEWGMDADGGMDEERPFEGYRQISDVTSGKRETDEEQVNEAELEEIYEFAATQRKRNEEEKVSVEQEEEVVEGEELFAELSERSCTENAQNLNPQLESDASYGHLFSDSWGVFGEESPPSPSTADQLKAHSSQSQKSQSSQKPSCEVSARTLLLSSPSVVDNLSLSPPPSTSNLPTAGLSPWQMDEGSRGDRETNASKLPEDCRFLKRESQDPHSVCVPVSAKSPRKKEPELIVLSDSSEEMEVEVAVLSSRSPSPSSPFSVPNQQPYTCIKQQSIPEPSKSTMETKVSSSLESRPREPSADSDQSHPVSGCGQSLADCSLEVSWLIPSTPVQTTKVTTTSSTQTRRSMCRTQLFPKGDMSSSSSPALSPINRLQTSISSSSVSALVGPSEDMLKLDEKGTCNYRLELKFSPKRTNNYDGSRSKDGFLLPLHQCNLTHRQPLQASLKQDSAPHIHPRPYSSTPLHTELRLPHVPLAASPLHSNHDEHRVTSKGRDEAPSESPEKGELASFRFSSLSDTSNPPSSSSESLHRSQRHSKSSNDSQLSVEYSNHLHTRAELKRKRIRDDEERGLDCEKKYACDEEKQEKVGEESGGAEAAESSVQQSFMDEPPIAFSDSWNDCIEANPGCFSLRLEDSHERSQVQSETARSSSSADHQPPPSSHFIQPSSCNGNATNSSPFKIHSTHPSSSEHVHTGPAPEPQPNSLLDSKIWDSWDEDDGEALPLSHRVKPPSQLKTPVMSHNKNRRSLVPITPMPHFSDMDTPELKNKLNRFGVRPLPKRQMILKLKEIHQYTHQLVSSSDSEDEALSTGRTAQSKPPTSTTAGDGPVSCAQTVKFKEPTAPTAISPLKHTGEEGELLSASQGSNTSSTAASEESERSNPELCLSSNEDSDSDGGISASQAANRLQDRLLAVRSFILSDSRLYTQILQYQPVVLSQLQERLKAAGIRLGAAKLVDYLDSQCITFTTAKPGHPVYSHRRGKRTGRGAKAAGERGVGKRKTVTTMI
ncbi:structure-specific endonuclease subunit SLX4 [Echeneis naucrates]|uniref:Structure-specific endonuclease subunit SLX4 n=1 Tax=Echeneis naucrates TaxID=173247 RepID=A0A665WPC0_ECHNA|nr:structure-specific endonuclease subunit SLX4 [Echeneis naucrates]